MAAPPGRGLASPAGPAGRGRRLGSLALAAARAPLIKKGKSAEYFDLPCRNALNRCANDQMPFEWSINPYRGCEFACRYCYARYTHEYIGLEESVLFETRIFAKTNVAEAFERDLPEGKTLRGSLAIGSVTDPYQPAERFIKATRRLLEAMSRRSGLRLSITTKSHLVTRDIDLLQAIAARNRISVNITITTLSRRLARMLEPRAPRPGRRLEALRALAAAGIPTCVFVMPVLPGITDAPRALESIVAAAARAGTTHLVHQALFLRSSAKKAFYPFLAEKFPQLAPRYRRKYGASARYSAEYRKRLDDLVEALKRQHGLGPRPRVDEARWQGEREERSRAVWTGGRRTGAQLALAF